MKVINTWKNRLAVSVILATAVFLVHADGSAQEAVPGLINYQGQLTDVLGQPSTPDGQYGIEFRIWSEADGGSLLWGGRMTVPVTAGAFNVLLGSGGDPVAEETAHQSLHEAIAAGPGAYLETTIVSVPSGPATGMTPIRLLPRQQLVSAPFAIKAETAEVAGKLSSPINKREMTIHVHADRSKEWVQIGSELVIVPEVGRPIWVMLTSTNNASGEIGLEQPSGPTYSGDPGWGPTMAVEIRILRNNSEAIFSTRLLFNNNAHIGWYPYSLIVPPGSIQTIDTQSIAGVPVTYTLHARLGSTQTYGESYFFKNLRMVCIEL